MHARCVVVWGANPTVANIHFPPLALPVTLQGMPAPSPNGNLLLLIDDDPMSREVLTLLATVEGFTVVAQDSGQAALDHLALAHALCPDFVLVDMQMPGLAGDALG